MTVQLVPYLSATKPITFFLFAFAPKCQMQIQHEMAKLFLTAILSLSMGLLFIHIAASFKPASIFTMLHIYHVKDQPFSPQFDG